MEGVRNKDDGMIEDREACWPSAVSVVERLLFRINHEEWVEDDEKFTG